MSKATEAAIAEREAVRREANKPKPKAKPEPKAKAEPEAKEPEPA
jgi:hypothetical protein